MSEQLYRAYLARDRENFLAELKKIPLSNKENSLAVLKKFQLVVDESDSEFYLNEIIKAGLEVRHLDQHDKCTYVYFAVQYSKFSLLRWLMKAPDIEKALQVKCGSPPMTPLEYANSRNQVESACILVRRLSEIPVVTLTDIVHKNDKNLLQAKLKEKKADGEFHKQLVEAFTVAVTLNYDELAQLILDAGLRVAQKDKAGNTALFTTVSSKKHKLLEKCLAATDAKEAVNTICNGKAPFDQAFDDNNAEAIELLEKHGAKFHEFQAPVESKPVTKRSRLVYMLKRNQDDEFNRLLNSNEFCTTYNDEVYSAMRFCIENDEYNRYIAPIMAVQKTIRLLESHTEPLLHLAVRLDKVDALKQLLLADDVNIEINQLYKDETLGDVILKKENAEMLALIAPFGPVFTPKRPPAPTPRVIDQRPLLIQAVVANHLDGLKKLLEKSHLLEQKPGQQGLDPVEMALIKENYAALILLYNAGARNLSRGLAMVGSDKIKAISKKVEKIKEDKWPLLSALSSIESAEIETTVFAELYNNLVDNKFNLQELELLAMVPKFKERLLKHIKTFPIEVKYDVLSRSVTELNNPLHIIWNKEKSGKPDLKVISGEVEKLKNKLKCAGKKCPPISTKPLLYGATETATTQMFLTAPTASLVGPRVVAPSAPILESEVEAPAPAPANLPQYQSVYPVISAGSAREASAVAQLGLFRPVAPVLPEPAAPVPAQGPTKLVRLSRRSVNYS